MSFKLNPLQMKKNLNWFFFDTGWRIFGRPVWLLRRRLALPVHRVLRVDHRLLHLRHRDLLRRPLSHGQVQARPLAQNSLQLYLLNRFATHYLRKTFYFSSSVDWLVLRKFERGFKRFDFQFCAYFQWLLTFAKLCSTNYP